MFGHVQTTLRRKLVDLKEAEERGYFRINPDRMSIGMKFTSSNQGNNVCGNKVLVIHGLKKEIKTQHISIVELIRET